MAREIIDIKYCTKGEGRCSWGYNCHDLGWYKGIHICEKKGEVICLNTEKEIGDLEKYLQDKKNA